MPEVGQYLHASCSDLDVYRILGRSQDENGQNVIDVEVLDINEVVHFDHDNDARGDGSDGKWSRPLSRIELPEGTRVIIRDMQWRDTGPVTVSDEHQGIVVNSPVGGCYRCSNLMWVYRSPGGRDPVKRSVR
jgi:hypothetical protein